MTVSGASLKVARRRKERRYPELVGDRGLAQPVVLAGEVGGRFSAETRFRQSTGGAAPQVELVVGLCCCTRFRALTAPRHRSDE